MLSFNTNRELRTRLIIIIITNIVILFLFLFDHYIFVCLKIFMKLTGTVSVREHHSTE